MRTLVIVTGGSAGLGRALLATAPAGARRIDVSRSGPGSDDPRSPTSTTSRRTSPIRPPGSVSATSCAEEIGGEPWERISIVHSAGTLDPIGFAGEVGADAYSEERAAQQRRRPGPGPPPPRGHA
jgi:benzil reductase ((S)-benzoin forming)